MSAARQNSKSKSGSEKNRPAQPPPLEWAAGAMGLVLFLSSLGFLLHEAIFNEESPPEVRLQIEGITEQAKGFHVGLRASNDGGTTAAALVIEGDTGSERSEVTVNYLPARSERRVGLFFRSDPRDAKLQVRALGYQEP